MEKNEKEKQVEFWNGKNSGVAIKPLKDAEVSE